MNKLEQAAKALLEHWDTPAWKYLKPTGDLMADLREALAKPVKQEPVATDLMDMLRLIETIKYLRGIAERGLGREIREDETIEQFVLGYVKQLESTQPVKQEPVAWHEPNAYGNVTTHKKWAEENGWLPLYTKE